MSMPRFSVVIPTRERAETLRSCLATCLAQEFDDYEIIVCDNCSSPATRQSVDSFASPKIKYVRAPEVLAMSSNWELALSHARGEYVTVLGDDDGLLSYALAELDRLIRDLQAKAIRWETVFYIWPTVALKSEANYLRVPLTREVRWLDAHEEIAHVIRLAHGYTILPMIYNAIIHRSLIEGLRYRCGRVFLGQCPDVYSGFAFAHLAGRYVSLDVPMSVSGLSGASNGVATLFLKGRSLIDREFRQLNADQQILPHPTVPDLPAFPIIPIADSFQIAKEALFPQDNTLELDRKLVISQCVDSLRVHRPEEWTHAMETIRQSLADSEELLGWFEAAIARSPMVLSRPAKLRSELPGFDGDYLHVNTQDFGIENVYEAAKLTEKILGFRPGNIRYGLPPWTRFQAEHLGTIQSLQSEIKQLTSELDQLPKTLKQFLRRTARRLLGLRPKHKAA
jgi:glycosyltransferase involved in cell wall biosynthesis